MPIELMLNVVAWSLLAWIVLCWQRLPGRFRTWTSTTLLLAGLAALGVAPFLAGSYSVNVTLFIAGHVHHVETIERSFGALAAGIGIVLLGLLPLSRLAGRTPGKGPLAAVVKLTLAVLVLRIYLEKLGVPRGLALSFGIIWLVVPVPIYLGWHAARAGSQRAFWGWLVVYTFGIRVLVVAVMLAATHFQLGTHFDNSSVTSYTIFGQGFEVEARSAAQYARLILFPQMILWPAVTLVAGVLLGWPAYLVTARRTQLQDRFTGDCGRC